MVEDGSDPNQYQRKLEREKERITEQNDDGEYRITNEQDRRDLRLYSHSVSGRVDYSCAFNYLGRLRRLSEVLEKPLRECDVEDIKLGMSNLAEKNLGSGKEYSNGTKRQYLRTVEDFGKERGIDALSDIAVPSVSQSKIDEDDVLSKEEVWDLIEGTDKKRTAAIIAVCWECAWRSTALLSLKTSNYEHVNDEYALLEAPVGVTGDKDAGGGRKPVTIARGYLDQWMSVHPTDGSHMGADPDAALFCRGDREDTRGDHMSGEAVRQQLNKAARNAGIDEGRVYVHCFRHARVTFMKKSSEYDDMDIEHTLDWAEGSNQMKRYAHLDQDDKIASILDSRGIDAEQGETTPETKDCPKCMQEIPYDARNCPYCMVRVDDSPADWYQVYTELINVDDDPLLQKYEGMSSTTPTLQRLPREQFSWVQAVLRSFLVERENLGEPPSEHDEIVDVIDVAAVSEDAVTAAEHLILTTDIKENYQEHPADYELSENEEYIEYLRGNYDPMFDDESGNPLRK